MRYVLCIDPGTVHFAWLLYDRYSPELPLFGGLHNIGVQGKTNKVSVNAALSRFAAIHKETWELADVWVVESQFNKGRPWNFYTEAFLHGFAASCSAIVVQASPRTIAKHFGIPILRELKKAATVDMVMEMPLYGTALSKLAGGRKCDDLADCVLFCLCFLNSFLIRGG